MNKIKLEGICGCGHGLHNNVLFTTKDNKEYTMNAKDALEISYTLFDAFGYSYDILDDLYEDIEKEGGM